MIKKFKNAIYHNRFWTTLYEYRIWLVSAFIFGFVSGGVTKGRELIINAYRRAGNYEKMEEAIWNFTIQDFLPIILIFISLLFVMICKRKGFEKLTHAVNHTHWFLWLLLIFGSQFLFKGEN